MRLACGAGCGAAAGPGPAGRECRQPAISCPSRSAAPGLAEYHRHGSGTAGHRSDRDIATGSAGQCNCCAPPQRGLSSWQPSYRDISLFTLPAAADWGATGSSDSRPGARPWTKSSPGCSGTTAFDCTRRWPKSARCGSKKTGWPANPGKPVHEAGYGIRIPGARSLTLRTIDSATGLWRWSRSG